jgi:DNA repair protein RadA/Sms
VLEHLVDTVLYFESDASSRFRNVRATKNRFGSVGELAFFHMGESGLREVRNPSAIFLARSGAPAPGSIVTVTRDGRRPLLVELQALVDRMRFGSPRRGAGLDATHRHVVSRDESSRRVSLQEHDVFVNLVGGLEVGETACDLLCPRAGIEPCRQAHRPANGRFRRDRLRASCVPWPTVRSGCAGCKQGFNVALIQRERSANPSKGYACTSRATG